MKAAIRHHLYIPGESDHAALRPRQLCATCRLPKANQRHQLPAVPKSVLDAEARRLGEARDQYTD